jgi:hypothetical protein
VGGRQLDREGNPVQATTDADDGGHVIRGRFELHEARPRTVDEQLRGLEARERIVGKSDRRVGQGKWRNVIEHLTRHPQRLAAGRQDLQLRCAAQQRLGKLGAAVEQVFAGVQPEEEAACAAKLEQRLALRSIRAFANADGDGNCLCNQIGRIE